MKKWFCGFMNKDYIIAQALNHAKANLIKGRGLLVQKLTGAN